MTQLTRLQTLDDYLTHAEKVVSEKKSRLTPIRRHIYKCLIQTNTPLGAYDILGQLDGVGAAKPPTVYRALDWLIEMGLAKKIESVSKYMATSLSKDIEQSALLLCQTCGHAEPFDAGPAIEALRTAANAKGFEKQQAIIEIIGYCAEHKSFH